MDGVSRRPRTRGPRPGRGVRVRGGGRPVAPAVPAAVEEAVVTRGRGVRGVRGVRGPNKRPGPATIDESASVPLPCSSSEEMREHPIGEAGPSHIMMPPSPALFLECGNSGSSTPCSPPPHLSSPSVQFHHPRPRQSLNVEDIVEALNYGSEVSSDESDDGELVAPFIPRVFRSVMETPLDEDDEPPVPATTSTAAGLENTPLTAINQPISLYYFDWRQFPNDPIRPESRRETFSQNIVGPTTPFVDPYDIFIAIWDRQFVEHIASETNRYAQQMVTQMLNNHSLYPNSRINQWRDTTVNELYIYFAIVLAMGVVVKSRLEEYWSATPDIFCTPGFRAHMSINRFILLNRCLHFNNNEDMCALELDFSEAKLFKIQPVLSHLNHKFQSLYNLGQNISLDESLVQWKSWLDINQLIPNKAATIGIKSYEICESQTGYLWRFEIHAHKRSPPQQHEDPLKSSTPAIVLRLTHGLEGKGHTLWMDNFYNSPCLARHLKSIKIDCVGTLRTNRQFVPQALHSLTKGNMRPGQITGLTSGDVDVMVWRDDNRVSMISTYHGNATMQVRGSTKPILILDYNIMMGGVDKKDQMLAMYPIERKRTMVWYKKLFRRLLNISVLNSYIIHRHTSSLSHRKFRMNLIKSLLLKHSSALHIAPLPPATTQNRQVDVTHRLGEYPLDKSQRKRLQCKVCKKRVHTFCVGCRETVCIDSCFLALHS